MTLTETVLVIIGIVVVVVVPLAISIVLSQRRRQHQVGNLRVLVCPHCGVVYGTQAAIRIATSLWNPAPGYSVWRLHLPNPSFFVKCSNCSEETEHQADGRVFELPSKGVRGRTILFSP